MCVHFWLVAGLMMDLASRSMALDCPPVAGEGESINSDQGYRIESIGALTNDQGYRLEETGKLTNDNDEMPGFDNLTSYNLTKPNGDVCTFLVSSRFGDGSGSRSMALDCP